jgi:ribosomal protein S27AE
MHPDQNNGDTSKVEEFTRLMESRREEEIRNRKCPNCGEPTFLKSRSHKHNKEKLFCNSACYRWFRFYRNRLAASALVFLLCLSCQAQTNGPIFLTWQYNSNTLAQADLSAGYTTYFIVYGTNAIGSDHWPTLMNKTWKHYTITKFNGVDYTFKANFTVRPVGLFYYKVTSSNFWGESMLSNTSSTPATASQLNVQLHEN